jgi:L-ascorbate metabolism protein UlaG (beta-lactamase superfamily)
VKRATFRFLGHSVFSVTSPSGKVVITDPWIDDNPMCPIKLADIQAADIVTVSHDHFDHIAHAADIAKKTGATIVTQPETANRLKSEEGVPEDNIVNFGMGMNIGGSIDIGGVTVTMMQAFHSSATGCPASFVVRLDGGATFYHGGDTGIFQSMSLISEIYGPEVALIPMGSAFVMDPVQAAASLKLLKPKVAIPMHYKTFPVLEQSADRFVELAKRETPSVKVVVLEPGEEFVLE